jgi:hypothetical protein
LYFVWFYYITFLKWQNYPDGGQIINGQKLEGWSERRLGIKGDMKKPWW